MAIELLPDGLWELVELVTQSPRTRRRAEDLA